MTAALVQSKTGSTGASNASSCTVTSSATTAGNLLIAFVWIQGTNSVTITAPSGWSIVGTTQGTSAGSATCGLYYRANTPGSLTSHQFTFGSSVNAAIAFEEWSGVIATAPLDQNVAQQNAQGTSTTTGTTAALASSGELAVWGAGVGATNALTYSSVTNSYTWDSSAQAFSSQGTRANANLFYNTNVGTAATSSGATASGTGANGNTTILAVFKTGTTTSHDWTVRGKTSQSSTTNFTARGRLSGSGSRDWTVRGRQGLNSSRNWIARGRLSQSSGANFTVRGRISQSTSHDWTVRGNVGNAGTRNWVTRGRISQSTSHDWMVRGRLGFAVSRNWTVRGRISTGSPSSGGFTLFANGTGTASFDHFRVTEYPDPSLSLAAITPRLGSTGVSWNALVPANTSLGVDISLDGISWTDVSSGNSAMLPGLYAQPTPTVDGFSVDSSASYISTCQSGGIPGVWTYDSANSRLIATGGLNALYLNSSISRADIDFFADLDQSDAGGMVWRFVDSGDYYYLLIADSLSQNIVSTTSTSTYVPRPFTGTILFTTSSSNSSTIPNTVTLYKVSSNTQTQLAQAAISYTIPSYMPPYTVKFTRGTFRRFRVTMLGGVITVYVDGNQLLSYTDSSPLGAGRVGLYNGGGVVGSRYYQLWIQPIGDLVTGNPAGDTVTGDFVYTRLRLATTDPTATPQVEDISTYAMTPDIQPGVTLPAPVYQASFVSKNFDDQAKQSNYSWYIDPNKRFHFRSYQSVAAPWILQSSPTGLVPISDISVSSNFERDVNNDLYRNRQIILGAWDSLADSVTVFGDGNAQQFTLGYPLATAPTITLNGIAQTVGLKGSSGYNWYYAVQDAVIVQDSSGVILQMTDTLAVSYTGLFEVTIQVDNVAEQARVAALEGGTGIIEQVEDHSSDVPYLSADAAVTLAQQLIDRYAIAGRTLIFDTTRDGLAIGQTLSIFFPEEGIWDGQFIITQVEISLRKGINDTQVWGYKVTSSELPKQASWAKLLASGLGLQ